MAQDHSKLSSPAACRGSYRLGRYEVSPEPQIRTFLTGWIASESFIPYERPDAALNHGGTTRRNRLYAFHLPQIQREVVMKVSRIDPYFGLTRKIDWFLYGLYKHGEASFHGAAALYAAGLPVAPPLAFWTCKRGILDKRSYFLYRKIPGQTSIKKLLQKAENEPKDHYLRLAKELIAIGKRIHDANLRHGDFHTGNVQVRFPRPTATAPTEKIQDAAYYVLDYDKVSKTKITTPWIKRIYDLKDLRKLRIPAVSDDELLEIYLGTPPPPRWSRTFKFWRNGGFNLRERFGAAPSWRNGGVNLSKRFRTAPRKKGKHLAG